MDVARFAIALLLAASVSGCTIGTVSTPSHFGGTGDYGFLAAGQQPIPATGGTVAVPFPDRAPRRGAEGPLRPVSP